MNVPARAPSRHSTDLGDADRIWVLEAGHVSEAGTHDELAVSGGLYAALWRVQTGERAEPAPVTTARTESQCPSKASS